MYDMGRVKIESMGDMESLLEGEWVEAPVGLHAKFVYSVDRENNRLTITLPDEVAKRIGDRLCATFDGGKIVISELLEPGADAQIPLIISGVGEAMDTKDRERKIASAIRAYYLENSVDCEWLLDKSRDMDNVFKRSFHAIWDYTGDFDLSLWYIAFSQSFGERFDVVLNKFADMCTNSDKKVITFKKDFPDKCPYLGSRDETIEEIFKIDFDKSNKEISSEIKKIYRSEKFFHAGKWCNLEAFDSCEYRNECPVSEWKELITRFNLRFRNEPKIFFYYDTLCLLHNKRISNFNELFSSVNSCTSDVTKKTVIIRTILEQIRGIATKTSLFLQDEIGFNENDFDDFELVFVDKLAARVAERMKFPFYENDILEAIGKFGKEYDLTAKQIDRTLWEMGFVCSADKCLHGVDGKECIFHEVCLWEDKAIN